ncbi:L,D-transpeptidase [Gammaproteobacteria bacterium]
MISQIIQISISEQRLKLMEDSSVLMDVRIASARNGVGEERGSEKTPRGWHRIRAKIGEGKPFNTVFVGRRPTGEVYSPKLKLLHPKRDWILTRILWLSGLEVGKNRFGNVDTMARYIYIHGCPDEDPMGIPSSHGCIKMRNTEIVKLFEETSPGTKVYISSE